MSSEGGGKQLPMILATGKSESIENIRFEFLDTNAVARSRTVPFRHLEDVCRSGVRFPMDLFVLDPLGNTPVVESELIKRFHYTDMVCFPDISTYTVLPWQKNTSRVFVSRSDAEEDGPKFLIDPRNILKAQLKVLEDKRLSILSSFEYEFWLVNSETRKPVNNVINSFSTTLLSKHQEFVDKVAKNLSSAGVDVESTHCESSPGLLEMTMKPSWGIRAADNAATFRTGVKEMALQHEYIASFMNMPFENEDTASCHLNFSLWSRDHTEPMLYPLSDPKRLSPIGEHWLAGMLEHAPALTALQAPTINCREMFKPQYIFSPTYATWGFDNRTCALRVKPSGPSGLYLENRLGTGAGNPYIVLASTIAAGLDGMNRKLSLRPPVPSNATADQSTVGTDAVPLPVDIECALDALKRDTVIAEAIGRDFIDALESIRRSEMKRMVGERFAWSRDLYLEFI